MQLNKYIIAAGALSLVLVACDRAETDETIDLPVLPDTNVEVELPDGDDMADSAEELAETVADAVQPERADTSTDNQIDWEKARADLAASDEPATRSIGTESTGSAPPVPLLLPSGQNVSTASTRSLATTGPTIRETADGYFAVYPGTDYDIIINGTNQTTDVAGKSRTRDESMTFTTSVAGAQVSLSRYGADYLVEFECRDLNEETGSCIEEEEAMSVAESLVIRGSR